MSTINPYANINWGNTLRIQSFTHQHNSDSVVKNLYNGGIRHFAISNYHPSRPFPDEDLERLLNYYGLSNHEPILNSPNMEHYSMAEIVNFHCNGLGSTYEYYDSMPVVSWKYKFDHILASLKYEDGGGITLNHPHWTKWINHQLTNQDLLDMLDYDNRVLGIEFFNSIRPNGTTIIDSDGDGIADISWDFDTWDYILMTGRRCWGFSVPDHDAEESLGGANWLGRHILLCSEFTEHECLKAYREGRFYCKIYNTDLAFTSISLNDHTLSVVTNNATTIKLIVDGIENTVNSSSASFNVPNSAVYARVEAHTNDDSIYSQPFIFKPYIKQEKTGDDKAKKVLLIL